MKRILIGMTLSLVATGMVLAQNEGSAFNVSNTTPCIIIKYSGTGPATSTLVKTSIALRHSGMAAQTLVTPTATNVGLVVGWINAQTNKSGKHVWSALAWTALNSEVFTNRCIGKTNAYTIGQWDYDAVRWNTELCDHYRVNVTPLVGDSPQGGTMLNRIYGYPQGTGNVTVAVYEDQTLKYQYVTESPYYTMAAVEPTVTTNTRVDTVNMSIDLGTGIYIGKGKVGFVSATRATSAQKGDIGATWLTK